MSRILIIQDEPLFNDVLKNAFSEYGIEVEVCESSEQAKDLIHEKYPAVIISDSLEILESNPPSAFVFVGDVESPHKIVHAYRNGALDFCLRRSTDHLFENIHAWIEVGKSLRNHACPYRRKKLVQLIKERCSELKGFC